MPIRKVSISCGNLEPKKNIQLSFFEEKDKTQEVFEIYSNFDNLGRCGIAYANICRDIMPKEGEKRGKISYKPTGWVQTIYNNGEALYNRSHLIAWQLGNENDNEKNLITGTRQMNEAMIPWENKVANWIKGQNKEGKDFTLEEFLMLPEKVRNELIKNDKSQEGNSEVSR